MLGLEQRNFSIVEAVDDDITSRERDLDIANYTNGGLLVSGSNQTRKLLPSRLATQAVSTD